MSIPSKLQACADILQLFELLTGEFLFDPQSQGELFTKDDDHMAQIIELLGDFSMDVKLGGKYSRELFDHTGMGTSCVIVFDSQLCDMRTPTSHCFLSSIEMNESPTEPFTSQELCDISGL